MTRLYRHIHESPVHPPGMLFHEVGVNGDLDIDKLARTSGSQNLQVRQDEIEMPSEIHAPTQTELLELPLATASGKPEATIPFTGDATATQAALSHPTASESSASSHETASASLSTGTIAAILFSIFGALLLTGLVVFLIGNKRRRNRGKHPDDGEKLRAHLHVPPTESNFSETKAPRLSLRPVTQFFTNTAVSKGADKDPGTPMTNTPGHKVPSLVPFQRSSSIYSENPFGSGAIRNPFNDGYGDRDSYMHRDLPPTPPEERSYHRSAAPAAAPGAVGVAITRETYPRSDDARPTDHTTSADKQLPPSPATTEISVAHAVDAPNSSPATTAPDRPKSSPSVHRVQLDFVPSLDDELELKAGEFVRLLHEYDDGWALCTKRDKSQQGVVPRSCLSTHPVKPRNPQGSVSSRPDSPNSQNPSLSPARGPRTTLRPHDPYKPQSPSGLSREVSPQGPSPLNPAFPGQSA